jgi:TRAP-type uncharacterized transport system substrate-binding protein
MNKVDAGSSEMNDLSGIRRTDTWLRQPLTIVMFWAAIAVALVYMSYRWIDPLPPRQLSIAAGGADSIYDNFARQYAQILARDGVQLNVRNTAGALENLRLLLLRDPASGVQAAFSTFGFTEPSDPDALNSLGGIFDGAIFIFYRNAQPIMQFSEFRGKRVAIGLPETAAGAQGASPRSAIFVVGSHAQSPLAGRSL